MRSNSQVLSIAAVFLIFALIAGCEASRAQIVQQIIQPAPLFPPQTIMETGDYASFFTENTEALKACQDPDKCTIALFNLAFLHSYSKSPYYDPRKALKYIEDLNTGAPGSQWAYQAMVWKELIEKNIQLQKKLLRKRPAREESKTKEVSEPEADESARQPETSPEVDREVDRQRLEDEVRSKDATIRELNRQIQKLRQIDIEIEKKERGLLY